MLTITVTAGDAMLWALAALVVGIVAAALWAAYLWCRMIYANATAPEAPPPPKPIGLAAVPAVPPMGSEGGPEMQAPDTIVRKFR